MAEPTDSVALALEDLENEPLPTQTREHKPPEERIEVDYDDEGGENRQERSQTVEKREIDAGEGIESLRARLLASDRARQEAESRAQALENARAEAGGAAQEEPARRVGQEFGGVADEQLRIDARNDLADARHRVLLSLAVTCR